MREASAGPRGHVSAIGQDGGKPAANPVVAGTQSAPTRGSAGPGEAAGPRPVPRAPPGPRLPVAESWTGG
jgi:hypothetical protein